MNWRGTTTPLDRSFACLPYLLPLVDVLLPPFSTSFFSQFPALQPILTFFGPLLLIYAGIPVIGRYMGMIIFFALFLLVVRNENIAHFVRFNAMQAILLDVVLVVCNIIFVYALAPILGGGLLMDTLFNVIFLGTLAAIIYSVAQSILGRYAEIPTISDAVHMQVR